VSEKTETKEACLPITMRYETRTRVKGEEPKRVGVWIRVSTEDQAKGESPEHHEARARMYAEMKGWEIVTVYHLEGVSGKSVLGFPEARRMVEDVEAGRIDALIFSKLARLARNTRELLDISDHFKACGAALVSLQESIDTSSAAGTFFYTLLGAMGQWERDEASERVAASVPIRAKLGKPIGGTGPFGYRWTDGKLLPDENEVPGAKLYVPSNNPKYVCQKKGCHTKIAIEDLERVFVGQLREFFLSPEAIARHLDAGGGVLADREKLLASLERERVKVSEEMDKLYHLYMEGHLTSEIFGRRHRPLEERLMQLEAEMPRLMGEIDFLKVEHFSSEEMLAGAKDLYERWPTLPFEEKRTIVEALVERITLGPEEVMMDLSYRPSPHEMVTKGIQSPSGW
jgi:DNA invertase Pin-like site-specific DNA recombinase